MTRISPADVRHGYDRGASEYDARHILSGGQRKYVQIERTIRAQLGRGQILDLGCGTGRLLKGVAAGRGIGIDISHQMLRQVGPTLSVAQADAHRLPFVGETFDAVVAAQGVMRYLDHDVVFGEIARVLRPGGRLAMHLFGRVFSFRALRYLATPLSIRDPQEVVAPATRAGLRTLAIELWRPIRIYPYAVRVPSALPGQLWTHFVALFEKAPGV